MNPVSSTTNSAAKWTSLGFSLLVFCACVGAPKSPPRTAGTCKVDMDLLKGSDAVTVLNTFSDLLEAQCPKQAIEVGNWIRATYREKSYSITHEVASILIPEESIDEYVMESFERAYLSFLMASAYLNLGKPDDAAIELRQGYHEGRALLYNYGDDPVNSLLAAVLWNNLGSSDDARPFWKRLSEQAADEDPARTFALDRLHEIDSGTKLNSRWRIVTLGRMPKLDWSIDFRKGASGYYHIAPLEELPKDCHSANGILLNTSSWIAKIGTRYASDYHPLLHLKSWVRFPVGIAYGVGTAAAGASVAVGGCALDLKASGNGDLCREAMRGGGYLMSKSGDAMSYAVKPDLRHWEQVPAAILITRAPTNESESCFTSITTHARDLAIPLH